MGIDEDFTEFVTARWASLYRLAYLLTASPTSAEDLLQTTLEKAYVNWSRIGRMDYAEAYVRRMLANTLVSSRRRKWNGEQPWDELPETAGDSVELPLAGPAPAVAAGVRAAHPAAGGDRAALLRGPDRGADRRRPRLRARHREVTVVGGDGSTAKGLGRVGRRGSGGGVMNLDEQLRAALNQEADMQDAPVHDVDRLISGGKERRRRRSLAQVGVAAAVVAVLVGVGVYGVTQLDSGDAAELGSDPSRPRPRPPRSPYNSEEEIHPGTYRMLVGVDDAGVAINADLTFYGEAGAAGTSRCCRTDDCMAGSPSTGPTRWRPGPAASARTRTRRWPRPRRHSRSSSPSSRGARSSSRPRRFRRSAGTPCTCRCGSTTTAAATRGTASPRPSEAVTASRTARPPRESSSTSGSWTSTGSGSWSTRGTTRRASSELVDEIARTRDSIAFVTEE